MRLLILISSLSGGGAERVAVRLANEMAKRHDVFIMPFSKSAETFPIDPRVTVVDETLYDLRESRGFFRKYYCKWRSAVHMYGVLRHFRSTHKIDTTLSLLLTPNLFNVFTGGGGRKILCERNNPRLKGRAFFMVTRFAYHFGDLIVFQSETVRDMFPEAVRRRSVILPNPVSVTCRSEGPREKTVVSAGRFKKQKDHGTLIRAFRLFYEKHPDWHLDLYGKGPLQGELKALTEELGLTEAIRFKGYRDDIHEQIRSAGMFVLSSRFEGQPNALLEAMMIGLPCVTSAYPGLEEFLKDSGSALTVPVGDVRSMAEAMGRIADEPGLADDLVSRAKAFTEPFETETVIPKWESVLFNR